MNKDIYTIEVDRHNPLAAIEEINNRTHQDIINDLLDNMPEPENGVRYVRRGLISEIAGRYGYTICGVQTYLERAGYYKRGTIPNDAPCFKGTTL